MVLTESDELKWIGRPVPRVDAVGKVTGSLKYMGDLEFPGMLWGRVLRAAHPHALIRSIDTTAAEACPGVVRVLTAADVPGLNGYGIALPDQPVLCRDKVRYMGDAVALVLAESAEEAAAALLKIDVVYETLPLVDDAERAMLPDSPLVHETGNVHLHTHVTNGDVEAGFAAAAVIVDTVYRLPRQMHAFLEPEQGVGVPDADGGVTVFCGAQHPYRDQMQISRALGIKPQRIRVVASPVGGAFGGKDEITLQILLAMGALATGRPVKIVLSREESVVAGWKRHPMTIHMRTGADAEGHLVAQKVRLVADTGAYASLGGPVTNLALEGCTGVYRIPNVELDGYCVYTNNGVAGAFRGFGQLQANYAMEQQMDQLADALGLSRIEIRRRNALRAGDTNPLGHPMVDSVGVLAVLEAAEQCELWARRHELEAEGQASAPWKRRAVGLAVEMQGTGLGVGLPDYGAAKIELLPGARPRWRVGLSCPDIGQGNSTAYAQMTAEALEADINDVEVHVGDTALGPDSGSCTASRSVYTGGNAIFRAATAMRELLRREAPRILVCNAEQAEAVPLGEVAARAAEQGLGLATDGSFIWPESKVTIPGAFGLPHIINTYIAHVALVEVDTLTGEVEVLRTFAAIDCGRVVNPQGLLGQSEGGMVMGMGYALMEDTLIVGGRTLTRNLSTYIIPTSLDTPQMDTVTVGVPERSGPWGAKGVGEAVMVPIAPAIALAIRRATGGALMAQAPATAERVYAGIRAGGGLRASD
jgi:CO/xanthine dehydrogenase Mo-binding subunit